MKTYGLTASNMDEHPMFDLPEFPDVSIDKDSTRAVVEWTAKSIAEFISPPKDDDEDNDFACEDVAAAIRGHFLETMLAEAAANLKR